MRYLKFCLRRIILLCSNQDISCVFQARHFFCSNQDISCVPIKRFLVFQSGHLLCSNQDISLFPNRTNQDHFSKIRNATFGRILANVQGFFRSIHQYERILGRSPKFAQKWCVIFWYPYNRCPLDIPVWQFCFCHFLASFDRRPGICADRDANRKNPGTIGKIRPKVACRIFRIFRT